MAAKKVTIKLTANFERNLEAVAVFLAQAGAPLAYDLLLDELTDTLIPNLEQFPSMGRTFSERPVHSVEVVNALERLQPKLRGGDLREYLFNDYLVLYARFDDVVHLLALKHHRQLSFDFQMFWGGN
jgi:plasmid stabilization system protein ParE